MATPVREMILSGYRGAPRGKWTPGTSHPTDAVVGIAWRFRPGFPDTTIMAAGTVWGAGRNHLAGVGR